MLRITWYTLFRVLAVHAQNKHVWVLHGRKPPHVVCVILLVFSITCVFSLHYMTRTHTNCDVYVTRVCPISLDWIEISTGVNIQVVIGLSTKYQVHVVCNSRYLLFSKYLVFNYICKRVPFSCGFPDKHSILTYKKAVVVALLCQHVQKKCIGTTVCFIKVKPLSHLVNADQRCRIK